MTAGSEASKGAIGVAIRRLAMMDVPAVLAILQASPEAAAWSQESLLQFASVEPAAWVADLDGVPAGFLIGRIAADEFEILNMAVSHAHRRGGIGAEAACQITGAGLLDFNDLSAMLRQILGRHRPRQQAR